MRFSFYPVLTGVILSGVLWVIPSLGTQGMGTIGQRFAHADRGLMVEDQILPEDVNYSSTRNGLLRADAAVELAVGR